MSDGVTIIASKRETCEVCNTCRLSECRVCDLSGEPNPEAFTRKELVAALVDSIRRGSKSTLHKMVDENGKVVHSFATMDFPLPKTHWIYQTDADGFAGPPPMGLRTGCGPWRSVLKERLLEAAKYAVRASTGCGKDEDFDPDAMVCNFLVGALGYHTETGLGEEAWENPPHEQCTPTVSRCSPDPDTTAPVGDAPEGC